MALGMIIICKGSGFEWGKGKGEAERWGACVRGLVVCETPRADI